MCASENTNSDSGKTRAISEQFLLALLKGVLNPILKRVQTDETLLLALRGDYINIYYRGGNLINIAEKKGGFSGSFDLNYIGEGNDSLRDEIVKLHQTKLDSDIGVSEWIDAIPKLKLAIDVSLGSGKDKHEREFQQLVARENNSSGISNATEYFIADIEYANTELGAKFDLLAIQWLANKRQDGSNCRLALVEMKYGDNALGGKSGLQKHLDDIQKLLPKNSAPKYEALVVEVESVFDQLRKLGLIRFGNNKDEHKGNSNPVKIDRRNPEIIILLANHNPRSTKLMDLLDKIVVPEEFDLRFFVASFAGYGMHSHNMFSLDKFKEFYLLLQKK